jgi:hypothetical protein
MFFLQLTRQNISENLDLRHPIVRAASARCETDHRGANTFVESGQIDGNALTKHRSAKFSLDQDHSVFV